MLAPAAKFDLSSDVNLLPNYNNASSCSNFFKHVPLTYENVERISREASGSLHRFEDVLEKSPLSLELT